LPPNKIMPARASAANAAGFQKAKIIKAPHAPAAIARRAPPQSFDTNI
jgi:hypothetical protein